MIFMNNTYIFNLGGCRSVFGVLLRYKRINLNKRLNKLFKCLDAKKTLY